MMATSDCNVTDLSIVSYNMHGYNQGLHTVRDLMLSSKPDIFILQEHWLTPANLSRFDGDFPQYTCFGSSAMSSCVESGVLRGRPFGGVMTLVSNHLQSCTEVVTATDRYVIVAVGDLVVINVYLPCVGTIDRLGICDELINSLLPWLDKYSSQNVVIGGDFNTDLDLASPVSDLVNQFITDCSFCRCDILLNIGSKHCTYYNDALNHESTIDFFLTSDVNIIKAFDVMDLDCNFSDHRPIKICCICTTSRSSSANYKDASKAEGDRMSVFQLRWDHADLMSYYAITGSQLQSALCKLIELERCDHITSCVINDIYCQIVDILRSSADFFVPTYRKKFLKFWWDQEMGELKHQSITSCITWKAAGRPRSGPLFERYRKDKLAYRNGIRIRERDEKLFYTNDLHEALLQKQGKVFWNCWHSKFESSKRTVKHVDGITDLEVIAEHFASHFSNVCSNSTTEGAKRLKSIYEQMRAGYCGSTDESCYRFDAELVETVVSKLKCG